MILRLTRKQNHHCYKLLPGLFLLFFCSGVFAKTIVFTGQNLLLGKQLEIATDEHGAFTINNVNQLARFKESHDETPNFGVSQKVHWLRFSIRNNTQENHLLLELPHGLIDSVWLYETGGDSIITRTVTSTDKFTTRSIPHHYIVFNLPIQPGQLKEYIVRVRGDELIIVPLILRNEQHFLDASLTTEVIAGIHLGVLLVMILYNLFIWLAVKDRSYLYLVLFILFTGLTQATIAGYSFKFFWPSLPAFNNLAIIVFPGFSGVFTILFFQRFLDTKKWVPKLNWVLYGIMALYAFAIVCRLAGFDSLSYNLIDFSGLAGTLLGFAISIMLSLRNYRPAKFFLLAWSFFLLGIMLFVLRNFNLLPYNDFTNYTFQAGTDIVVILLSFALADKINILKKEEAASREQALKVSKLNEQIIREQNVLLEHKVEERTVALRNTNDDLSDALAKLKDAQIQLIDSEKMASLGQLTAGIAHEINNPINFVSSNIKPLRRDIEDIMELLKKYEAVKEMHDLDAIKKNMEEAEALKQEIDFEYLKEELEMLLAGMEDGARRTVEIVKGLKLFSRVDEAEINIVNINEGIEATLVILNNQMTSRMKLVKNLASIPAIECYPGKLNQVFMNILTNSIHATLDHPDKVSEPVIEVATSVCDESHVLVSIKDNGIGMTPEVKAKIFEPFFTTKEVGKGTGLGLSIVFKIIQAHNGTVQVNSEPGCGTEFAIKLPIRKQK